MLTPPVGMVTITWLAHNQEARENAEKLPEEKSSFQLVKQSKAVLDQQDQLGEIHQGAMLPSPTMNSISNQL